MTHYCGSIPCETSSSGGVYPGGYCVYEYTVEDPAPKLISCHCKKGYKPSDPPGPPPGVYTGLRIRVPCEKIGADSSSS